LPFDSVRVVKTTSLMALIAVLPQVIWSFTPGRMTMLVLLSLGAIVLASATFGITPIHINIGSRPCIGVNVGQGADELASFCPAIPLSGKDIARRAAKDSAAVFDLMLEVMVIFYAPFFSTLCRSEPRARSALDGNIDEPMDTSHYNVLST
jgi:hypothetical protein